MQQRKLLSYLYAGLFLVILAVILIGNAWLLTENTEDKLIKIYWKETEIVSETIAISAKNAISSQQITEEYLFYYAEKLAESISDEHAQLPLTPERLKEIQTQNNLEEISLFDQNGHLLVSAGKANPKRPSPSYALPMDNGLGHLIVTLGQEKLVEMKIKEALGSLARSLQNRRLVEYISFYDHNLIDVGDTDPERIGFEAVDPTVMDAYENRVSYFKRQPGAFEMITHFQLDEEHIGVFHMGLSTVEIDQIYNETVSNGLWFSGGVMVIALIGTFLLLRFQNNSLYKMELMQKKIQENEKLVSLGNFAAGVAHEIRNPLNSISITIQRLQLEFMPEEQKNAQEYGSFLSLMKKEVDRLNQIITDFLSFAKPFTPKSVPFSIQSLLHESLTLFVQEAEQKGIHITSDFQIREDQFYGDFEKLKQVFLNLFQNALDATPAGRGILVKSYQNKQKEWVIEVIDEGMGIPPAKLSHIFDIYFTTKANGTGLGLYICRKIVQAHAGNIELIPNPTQGITARVILPKTV